MGCQSATLSSVSRATVQVTAGPEIVPRSVRIIFDISHRSILTTVTRQYKKLICLLLLPSF